MGGGGRDGRDNSGLILAFTSTLSLAQVPNWWASPPATMPVLGPRTNVSPSVIADACDDMDSAVTDGLSRVVLVMVERETRPDNLSNARTGTFSAPKTAISGRPCW